jgi:hypothetical protein
MFFCKSFIGFYFHSSIQIDDTRGVKKNQSTDSTVKPLKKITENTKLREKKINRTDLKTISLTRFSLVSVLKS